MMTPNTLADSATAAAWVAAVGQVAAAVLGLAAIVVSVVLYRKGKNRDDRHERALAEQAKASADAIAAETADRASQLAEIRAEAERRQEELDELHKDSKRRDETLKLLTEQVEVLRAQEAKANRSQAEGIRPEWGSSVIPPPSVTLSDGDEVHAAFVSNFSGQLIRDVRAGIKFSRAPGEQYHPADANAINARHTAEPLTGGERQLYQNDRAAVIQPGDEQVFLFGHSVHKGADIAVRFIDRAGVAWQIDPDYTLKPLAQVEWMYP